MFYYMKEHLKTEYTCWTTLELQQTLRHPSKVHSFRSDMNIKKIKP